MLLLIFCYLIELLLPAVTGLLLFVICTPWRRQRLLKHGLTSSTCRELFLALFVSFLAGLASMTLTPYGYWPAFWSGNFLPVFRPFQGGLNLMPFNSLEMLTYALERHQWGIILINFPGNILVFVPVGFFTALLWSKPSWIKSLCAGFLGSLTIEVLQLFIARGTDIDDVILNLIGALCGYWLYYLLNKLAPRFVLQCRPHKMEVPYG